ncbi:MAG: glycosyltransferase [Magnetococcales bacterium]|nr:glycosyltransferase [Magnetococcales bacterium]
MSLSYSLIMPYHRTPTITRFALRALQKFCTGVVEVLLVHHDPEPTAADLALFAEFPDLRVLHCSSSRSGSAAQWEAIDVGWAAASHDLVGILHSDTIFLKMGWDEDLFAYMTREELDIVGTCIREITPFRSRSKKIADLWRELSHKRHPKPDDNRALVPYFLLTRQSVLTKMGYSFLRHGDMIVGRLAQSGYAVGLLSRQEVGNLLWHIGYTTRLLCGPGADGASWQGFRYQWENFLRDPYVASHFADLGDPLAGLGPGSRTGAAAEATEALSSPHP